MALHRWQAVVQCLVSSIALALLTFVCFRLRLNLATVLCLYLIVVGLLSLRASFRASAVVSFIAVGCLAYFFVSPIFSFRVSDPSEVAAILAFLTSTAVVTRLVSSVRNSAEKLRQSEAYLTEGQRLSHTGSWGWIPATGEIRYWSEECYRVLGFDRHSGQPRFETFFQRIHLDDQARTRRKLEEARREKVEFELDYRIVHPGDEIRDIHVAGHPVLSPSGDLVEFVGTVIDVTERKRAEEERERLRQAQVELAHINRVTTMGELTASMAHEVNQPIATAVTDANTCLRWLTRDQLDLEEARQAASRIVQDTTRAADIIGRIRLIFKKGTRQRALVDVNEVIREMIVLLSSVATRRYSISIRTELAADLPHVMGDRVQLQQELMNLMVNRFDATKHADGPRDLIIKSEAADRKQIVLSISDTGVGLPPREVNQIFNPFFTTKPHGTGMGLRISRSIAESHGGRLWAAETSPCGASFYLALPSKVEASE